MLTFALLVGGVEGGRERLQALGNRGESSLIRGVARLSLCTVSQISVTGAGSGVAMRLKPEEEQANEWATNFLVPRVALNEFVSRRDFRKADIVAFAKELGIAPGIIVGQLQKREVIAWNSPLNKLKATCRLD